MNTDSPPNSTPLVGPAASRGFSFERIAVLLLALVPAISVAGVVLLALGVFRAGIAVAIGLGAALWLVRGIRNAPPTRWPAQSRLGLFLVLLFALLLRWPPGLHVQGGQDHGVYMSIAAHFADRGTLEISDLADRLVSREAVERYYNNNGMQPGVYPDDAHRGRYDFQFYHVHPIWLAIFGSFFGMSWAGLSQIFFALLSLLFGALVTERIAGSWRAGIVYAAALAIAPLHVFFSKFPISEMPTLALALMAAYAMLRYADADSDDADTRWLVLAALAFATLFLTRISGFVYLPFAYAGALACQTFVDDPGRRRNWGRFWVSIFALYFASVLYGLIYSRPYSLSIYAMHLGARALPWMPPLLATAAAAGALPFLFLRGAFRERVRRGLERTWALAQRWNPALLLIIVALGAVRVGLLAFTDHYRGNSWYDATWRLSHGGAAAVESSALVLIAEYLGPVVVALLFLALWRTGRSIPRVLLTVMVLAMIAYSALLQWFLPQQYYYGRYLLSEVVPFALLLVVVRCADWWSSPRVRPYLKAAAAFTAGWFLWFTLPLVGVREGSDGEASLAKIAARLDGGSVLLVDETSIGNAHRFVTPLRIWFGKQVYCVRHWSQIYDIVRDLRRAGMNNLLLLSATDDVPAPFEFDTYLRFEQHAMASTLTIPRKVALDAQNLTLARLGPDIVPRNALAIGIELVDLPAGCCSGFFPGRFWTKGSASIRAVPVPQGTWHRLIVTMHGSRPDYAASALRVRANGGELPLLESEGTRFVFSLDSLEPATSLDFDVESTTFVPREAGMSIDERQLGVDIASLRVE